MICYYHLLLYIFANMNNKLTYEHLYLHSNGVGTEEFAIYQVEDFLKKGDKRIFSPYTHSSYQIIWFTKGVGTHYIDGRAYNFMPDTLFCLSPGQIHWFEEKDDVEGTILDFCPGFLAEETSSENIFLKYNIFNSFDSSPRFRICEQCIHNLSPIIKAMHSELNMPQEFAHIEYLKNLIKLFLIEVQRLGKRSDGIQLQISNVANTTFVRFRQLLEQNYKQIHTVKDYASLLNISLRTLNNYVQESGHTTPLRMINARILLEAKRLLQYSSMKVKEIAYELGFEDVSYFVKFFKRQAGMLPLEFREYNVD